MIGHRVPLDWSHRPRQSDGDKADRRRDQGKLWPGLVGWRGQLRPRRGVRDQIDTKRGLITIYMAARPRAPSARPLKQQFGPNDRWLAATRTPQIPCRG